PDQAAGDQGSDGCPEAIEECVQVPGDVGLDVEDREGEHENESRQHEPESGDETTQLAATQPAEVDAQLVRLGPRKHLVYGENLLKGVLRDPMLFVHALALDHRDL